MTPLRYHAGQIEVQQEANSRSLADQMAHWVGPAFEFAERADLLLFAAPDAAGTLKFDLISGPPPLVRANADGSMQLLPESAHRFRDAVYGVLAMNLAEARRSRINGTIRVTNGGASLDVTEAFTLCRKYLARSVGRGAEVRIGPAAIETIAFDDAWAIATLAAADTSFLASITPDGAPDVAHRGGPAGFLEFDPKNRTLGWVEYVGDGVFKSAGNVRATGRMSLLVPDFTTGDAVLITGRGRYTNERVLRSARNDALEQHDRAHPPQGRITCEVEAVLRLRDAIQPRAMLASSVRVSSASSIDEQMPQ